MRENSIVTQFLRRGDFFLDEEYAKILDIWQDFEHFIKHRSTVKQKKDMLNIEQSDQLFIYMVCSYNCYAIAHSKESMFLITNPDALFMSEEERAALVEELKKYIRDTLTTQHHRKEVQYAQSTGNRANKQTTENKG